MSEKWRLGDIPWDALTLEQIVDGMIERAVGTNPNEDERITELRRRIVTACFAAAVPSWHIAPVLYDIQDVLSDLDLAM